jgi:nucleotide-binding universal stress UspA family protein
MIDLALIDLSPNSPTVIGSAYWWSTRTGGELHLLHDLKPRLPALSDMAVREQWFLQEETRARQLALSWVDQTVPGIFPPVHISRNNMVGLVERLQENLGVRMVFAGAKGAGILSRLLLGSHIITLTEHFQIPIMAVPAGYTHHGPVDLVVAVGHEHPVDGHRLGEFLSSHRNAIGSVELVAVDREPTDTAVNEAALERLAGQLGKGQRVERTVLQGSNVLEVLKRRLVQRPSGMLLVHKGSRGLLDHTFRSFMVNELVHDGTVPLIILS